MKFLNDKALSWAYALWQGKSDDQLITMFLQFFDQSPDSKEISEKLLKPHTLKQGQRRAAEYALEPKAGETTLH